MILGDRLELTVGPVAHGGHCVARVAADSGGTSGIDDGAEGDGAEGMVVFVRHALPGERVVAEVTEVHRDYLRADAVRILTAAADRVEEPCPHARPGLCGGCDLQHVAVPAQLAWKAAVVREQLTRLARFTAAELDDLGVHVEPLPGGPLGWRTRVRYAVDAAGRAGLLQHRSHQVVPIDYCRIAHPAIQRLPVTGEPWPDADAVQTIASSCGDVAVLPSGTLNAAAVADPTAGGSTPPDPASAGSGSASAGSGSAAVRERAVGREWALPPGAFWQVHPAAPGALAAAVIELLDPRRGETAWDLYGGAGLFAAALAAPLGPTARITLVESSTTGAAAARANLGDLPVEVITARVETALARRRITGPVDLVVLDPPRTGAGTAVTRAIMAAGPRAVAYVACDPAALARDVRTFRDGGWRLAALRGFDCFPMTHHVEVVSLLVKDS